MKNNIKFVKPKIMKKFLLFLFLVILGFECKSQALYPFPSPAYFSDSVQIKGSISFKNRLHFGDSLITKMMQGIIPDTTWVGVQLKTRGGGGGGGSMTWPTGGAGIPYYSGSSTWGSSFTTSNKIPRTYADTLTGGLKSQTAANADSTKLHNEIVKKLNIADTTNKWLYYNGKAVNSAKLQGKDTTAGGIETQTMAAKKLNVSDTVNRWKVLPRKAADSLYVKQTQTINGTAYGSGNITLYEKVITGLVFDSLRFNHIQSIANDYTVTSSIVIVSSYLPKTAGSYYYVRFIGDGTNIPDFSNCVKVAGSPSFSPTLNAINDMIFWWNGHSIIYNIIQY